MNHPKKSEPELPRGGLYKPHAHANSKPLEPANDTRLKVCQRASGLKLYAIVMLAIGILSLITAIVAVVFLARWSPHSYQNNATTVLGVFIALFITLPTLTFAYIFLLSRTVRLVKTILAVILIFYILSIISSLLTLFKLHNANTSVGFISLTIDACLAYWTYNVFSQVSSLD